MDFGKHTNISPSMANLSSSANPCPGVFPREGYKTNTPIPSPHLKQVQLQQQVVLRDTKLLQYAHQYLVENLGLIDNTRRAAIRSPLRRKRAVARLLAIVISNTSNLERVCSASHHSIMPPP